MHLFPFSLHSDSHFYIFHIFTHCILASKFYAILWLLLLSLDSKFKSFNSKIFNFQFCKIQLLHSFTYRYRFLNMDFVNYMYFITFFQQKLPFYIIFKHRFHKSTHFQVTFTPNFQHFHIHVLRS